MQNPCAKYKQQSIVTMTRDDVIDLLFGEMINRLNKGFLGLEVRDYEASNTRFEGAQVIINHLVSTLDYQHPVPQSSASLYEYFNYQILQANVRKSPRPVNEVFPMITKLKEVFTQAGRQVRTGHTGWDEGMGSCHYLMTGLQEPWNGEWVSYG